MILDAREFVNIKTEELKNKVKDLSKKPKLVIIKIGNDAASAKYVDNKIKLCDSVGIESQIIHLDECVTNDDVATIINNLNTDITATSILLQLPLPKHLDEKMLIELIDDSKDADGFTSGNLGKLMMGMDAPRACTPHGIMSLLKFYDIEIEGKDVLIINRSTIVGKPLAMMMLEKNATVTIAHSKTKNLKEKCLAADIIITAIGKAKFFDETWFNDTAVVVDVSINIDENGKLSGDVDKECYDKINMITPVPNGVGRTTVLALVEQSINNFLK